MNYINKIYVHGGVFHADDVCCVAMAQIINPEVEVARVFKAPDTLLDGEVICDIGCGKYDHHQADAELRADGRKRAACGLLFRDIKHLLFPREEQQKRFEQSFLIPIEDQDNGYESNILSVSIKGFNPQWNSKRSSDDCFNDAVSFMKRIIENEIAIAEAEVVAEEARDEALKEAKEGVVLLSRYIPGTAFIKTGARFIIAPSNRGGYNISTVKADYNSFEDVEKLPESWLTEKPAGCTFVHQGRFIAAFETLESALAACPRH